MVAVNKNIPLLVYGLWFTLYIKSI